MAQIPRQPRFVGKLSDLEPDKLFELCRKLVRPRRTFPAVEGDCQNRTVDLETFLRILRKYEEPLGLQVVIVVDGDDPNAFHLSIGGITRLEKLSPYKRRWLSLELNEVLPRGVMKEAVEMFRSTFGIKDGDKKFFARYQQSTL